MSLTPPSPSLSLPLHPSITPPAPPPSQIQLDRTATPPFNHLMQPDDASVFPGSAFHPELGKRSRSGQIRLTDTGVAFSADEKQWELPWSGLGVELGGAGDRLLFFKHPEFPGWVFFTSDRRALNHPRLAGNQDLLRQKANIQRKLRLSWVILAVTTALLVALIALPFLFKDQLVQVVASQIPLRWEQQLGAHLAEGIREKERVITATALEAQLESITQPLVNALDQDQPSFHFYIIEDSSINAFALPGGYVFIHSGLLLQAETPEEVAGVLAHEIAHVTKRHGFRKMIESASLILLLQAVLGDVAGVSALITENAALLLHQKFSRDFEREADEAGWDLLLEANIDPRGMIQFFDHLLAEARSLDRLGSFLSSHPATSERIDQLEGKWQALDNRSNYLVFPLNFESFQHNLRNELQPVSP